MVNDYYEIYKNFPFKCYISFKKSHVKKRSNWKRKAPLHCIQEALFNPVPFLLKAFDMISRKFKLQKIVKIENFSDDWFFSFMRFWLDLWDFLIINGISFEIYGNFLNILGDFLGDLKIFFGILWDYLGDFMRFIWGFMGLYGVLCDPWDFFRV